ncbi:MAG: hypothetical protein IBX55_01000 [Methyloprofundus sp.]|nr:hypothetical protein [Methyloprofundus sp.]
MQTKILQIQQAIAQSSPSTKIYLGSDSIAINRRMVGGLFRIATVVVLHIDGSKGCQVFSVKVDQKGTDHNLARPFNRMLAETYETLAMFEKIKDFIGERDIQIHLDVNPDEQYGSNVAIQAAAGLILGVTQIQPKVKPHAFAASCAADRFVRTA